MILTLFSLFLQSSLPNAQMEFKIDQVYHTVVTAEQLLHNKVVDGMGPVRSASGVSF